MMFLSKSVAEVPDLLLIVVDLIVPDVAKVTCGIELCGEGLADIPMDVVHSGGPHMVQPCFEPIWASTKLACTGTNKQVFQISGTLVAFVLVAQCDEVGHGNEFPRGAYW